MSNTQDDLLPEEILQALGRTIAGSTSEFGTSSNQYEVKQDLKFLRNVCAKGSRIQEFIISTSECEQVINMFSVPADGVYLRFAEDDGDDIRRLFWQFLSNLCVQNETTQTQLYSLVGGLITESCLKENISELTDIKLMILYNICKGGKTAFSPEASFIFVAQVWSKVLKEESNINLVFLHLFFEYFLTDYQWTCRTFVSMEATLRIDVLRYIWTYIQNDSPNGSIKPFFMEFISKEFKKKSDTILKTESSDVENLHPQEVLAILRVIASASGSDLYYEIYKTDESLFLYVGKLLQSVVAIGKNKTDGNIFTPMDKLAQVAPNSNISWDFEMEISFELKTLLVRTLANLAYKNPQNQERARSMGLLYAVLDCTAVDARNPLMKEWSIVAIRNLCDGCVENQDVISQLSKVGDAPNDALKELNIELGSLRIQPGV